LPVSADPAVQARGGGQVVRRVVIEHLDVAREGCAQKRPLNQVVGEQGVLREAPLENGIEDVDLEDALAGEGAFPENVLIRV